VLHVQIEPGSDPIQGNSLTGDQVKAGLQSGATGWNNGCSTPYIPTIEIDAGTTRDTSTTSGAVAVGVMYEENTIARPGDSPDSYELAHFDSGTGVMTVYGQCPNQKGAALLERDEFSLFSTR
jgi:hypothetical protein